MPTSTLGPITRAVSQSDVSHAADSLLRAGERPSIEKVRARIGKGSPNTINPMLDAWWKTLSARLDSGPAALHRLPETVAHVAEALWMQALEEGRRRAHQELKTSERLSADKEQNLEVRSHVLTLREGELDSRLRDRDRTIEELNLRLRELTGLLRKEQATRESLTRRLTTLTAPPGGAERPSGRPRAARGVRREAPNNTLLARMPSRRGATRTRTPSKQKKKKPTKRAAPFRRSKTSKSAKSKKPRKR
jgi:Plasmid replication region DNA-binding N-term